MPSPPRLLRRPPPWPVGYQSCQLFGLRRQAPSRARLDLGVGNNFLTLQEGGVDPARPVRHAERVPRPPRPVQPFPPTGRMLAHPARRMAPVEFVPSLALPPVAL